jgi:hypothetical protein
MTESNDEIPESSAVLDSGRRSGRIATELWVNVGDGDPSKSAKRKGDLAATGVYLSTSQAWGSPGDVVPLTLESPDRGSRFFTLARIARVLRQDDRVRGARVIGVGYEFLPLNKIQPGAVELLERAAIHSLTKLGQLQLDDPPLAYFTTDVSVRQPCRIKVLGREQVTIHTQTALPLRHCIELVVPEEDAHPTDVSGVSLRGELISCTLETFEDSERFTSVIHLEASHAETSQTVLSLARRFLVPDNSDEPERSSYDFRGELGVLNVTQVLQLLEQEHYSGVLSAGDGSRFYSAEVTDGRIVSVEPAGSNVSDLLALSDGEFQFKNRRLAQIAPLTNSVAKLMRDVFEQQPWN